MFLNSASSAALREIGFLVFTFCPIHSRHPDKAGINSGRL